MNFASMKRVKLAEETRNKQQSRHALKRDG